LVQWKHETIWRWLAIDWRLPPQTGCHHCPLTLCRQSLVESVKTLLGWWARHRHLPN
jgi:hypothetical protein